jgi:hypothetical protein
VAVTVNVCMPRVVVSTVPPSGTVPVQVSMPLGSEHAKSALTV